MKFAVDKNAESWAVFTIKRTLDLVALEMEKAKNNQGIELTPDVLRNAKVIISNDNRGTPVATILFVKQEENPLDTTFKKED